MPPIRIYSPQPLQVICISEINQHLIRELHLCYQVRRYEEKSYLLRRRNLCSVELETELANYLAKLPPPLSAEVRQQVLDILMRNYPPKRPKFVRNNRTETEPIPLVVDHRVVLEMLSIILDNSISCFEFHHKSFKPESSIWKTILAKCQGLKCLRLVPTMFVKSESIMYLYPFLSALTVTCPMLTELVLKDAISDFEPLVVIGKNCHRLRKLDLTGSQVDCKDMFSLCVNSVQDNVLVQFNEFFLGMDDHISVRQEDCYPLCRTMEALILCNTNVRSQGAGLLLRLMPNLQTLGSLVYTASGMKNLYNLVRSKRCAPLKLKEIYYRGPSNIKMKLLSCCCPSLELLSLGSNPTRRIQDQSTCAPLMKLHTLKLENIHPDDIKLALLLTPNLQRLELDCLNMDLSVVARHCPKLKCLVLKKEPLRDPIPMPNHAFSELEELKVEAPLSLAGASLFFLQCKNLKVMELVRVRDLQDSVLATWLMSNPLSQLEELIIRYVPLTRVSVTLLLKTCRKLTKIGELGGWDVRSWECRRIQQAVWNKDYDLEIVLYSNSRPNAIDVLNDANSGAELTDSDDGDSGQYDDWV